MKLRNLFLTCRMTMIDDIIEGLLGAISLIITLIGYILLFVIFLIMILVGVPILFVTSPVWIILLLIDRKENKF
nr:MAG TPA: hypothetical protein [Caudoviricetes sp.]